MKVEREGRGAHSEAPVVASVPPEAPREPRMEEKEYNELRKEIIEARNLVIKTDNLLKNLHAELKLVGKRQEVFERRHVLTSATAMGIVAVLCTAAAIVGARAYVSQSNSDSEKAKRELVQTNRELEELKSRADTQKRTSEAAVRLYAKLASEKAEERAEALAAIGKMDRSTLTSLEAASLDSRVKEARGELATGALERGRSAFRREDWKVAEKELERYLELDPHGEEASLAQFQLGNARFSLREYASATEPLEKFIAAPQGQRNVDWAYWLLGQAYEESNQNARAQEALTRGLAHYGQSQFAPLMRGRLRKLSGVGEPAQPVAAPAPVPPVAPPAPPRP